MLRLEKAEEIVTKEAELINRRIMPERLEEAILEVINMIHSPTWRRSGGGVHFVMFINYYKLIIIFLFHVFLLLGP